MTGCHDQSVRRAVILPGSGSTADFVTRAFGPPLAAAGYAVVAVDPPAGPDPVTDALRALDAAARRHRPDLVGGVSLGAHLAVRWAATADPPPRGLLLALPAWTGEPAAVAAASGYAADRVDALGVAGALAEARRGGEPWVAAELAAAWPVHGDRLAETLRATGRSRGPTAAELAGVGAPVGIAAFTDDPLHPLAVAREWARLLPRAGLRTLALADAAADRAVIGAAALSAWRTVAG
jgi:pimeloyl-ACP methyl ester carboxylesterase